MTRVPHAPAPAPPRPRCLDNKAPSTLNSRPPPRRTNSWTSWQASALYISVTPPIARTLAEGAPRWTGDAPELGLALCLHCPFFVIYMIDMFPLTVRRCVAMERALRDGRRPRRARRRCPAPRRVHTTAGGGARHTRPANLRTTTLERRFNMSARAGRALHPPRPRGLWGLRLGRPHHGHAAAPACVATTRPRARRPHPCGWCHT